MQKIGVFTSGGDSPGMNACIRAVVRSCIYHNIRVFGIKRGYEGMIQGDIEELSSRSVSNIIQRGGTKLKSARSDGFFTAEGRKQAFENLQKYDIQGLVAIGGDGTFRGAKVFSDEFDIKIIGVPGTIDNDLYGTDSTLGYDTALNTVVEAIDKIRDTANSHDRLFFIEVMGRDAGFIALRSGIASGAEAILIPEQKTDIDELIKTLEAGKHKNKTSSIVVVAEGDDAGGAFEIAAMVKERFTEYDTRVTVLGHIQRGGAPSCADRVLGSTLGLAAVEALMEGKSQLMAGMQQKKVIFTPFDKTTKHHEKISNELLNLAKILSS